ncbi:MAG: hypothetical protein QMC83_10380, partial [Thermodesulfovibrionales bacterium]|nr:hypothetical protein [Thermodesulfovibrionales bacterium]
MAVTPPIKIRITPIRTLLMTSASGASGDAVNNKQYPRKIENMDSNNKNNSQSFTPLERGFKAPSFLTGFIFKITELRQNIQVESEYYSRVTSESHRVVIAASEAPLEFFPPQSDTKCHSESFASCHSE